MSTSRGDVGIGSPCAQHDTVIHPQQPVGQLEPAGFGQARHLLQKLVSESSQVNLLLRVHIPPPGMHREAVAALKRHLRNHEM